MKDESLIILFLLIFLLFWIIIPSSKALCQQENTCPTSSDQCLIGCGVSNTGQVATVGNANYFNYTLTAPKRITIKATLQALTDYELYANWTAGQCPTTTSYDNSTIGLGLGNGGTRTLTHNLTVGNYNLMIWLQGKVLTQTYTLALTCEEIPCTKCPTTENACSISCGQKFYGLANATQTTPEYYYFKFNLSNPKSVTINVIPTTSLTDYKICVKDNTNQCPTESDVCVDNFGVSGNPEILTRNFAAGTYYLMIKLKTNLNPKNIIPAYDLNMSCDKLSEGGPCNSGDDCQSNVCINGICQSCNSTYYGGQCSWDAQDGMCVKNSSSSGGDDYIQSWNFSISGQGTNAVGIAYDGTYFFVVFRESGNRKIYRYNSDGSWDSGWGSLDVTANPILETAPEGLDANGTHIFLTGSTNDKVYIFKYDKTYVTSFQTTQGGVTVGIPTSVTFNGSYYWISNSESGNRKVYRYTSAGVYNSWNFDPTPPGISLFMPDGLEFNGTNFFVADYNSGKIYFYDSNGNYLYKNFSVTTGVYGLEYYNGIFYTVDYNSPYVRSYVFISYPCDYDEVCYDNTNYLADCSMCSNNNACDSDIDASGYSRDGSCQGVNCCLFTAACDLDSPDCDATDSCISASGGWKDYNDNSNWDTSTNEDCTSSCTCSQTYTTRDNDLLQTSCTNCVGAGRWNMGGDVSNCCSDDSNEYPLNSNYHSSIENPPASSDACCNLNSKCVHNNLCYANAATTDVNGDGDLDYCNSGTWLDCIDSSQCNAGETCQSNDCVVLNYLIIQSTILSYWEPGQSKWITSDPLTVPPSDASNRQMNVTVNVDNSSIINSCTVRIFNGTGSYLGPYSGTLRKVGSQIQCYRLWDMEYWRNPGQWNVSVDLTSTVSNFTSKNFTYAKLVALTINVTNIDFGTGYPGDRVNSFNSYPLGINNTGNAVLNIYINGSDFVGQTNSTYIINVRNITYSKDKSVFTRLTETQQLVYSNLYPRDTQPIYFNMSIPIGYLNQNYYNNININATG
jgi:hypothetical protein